MNKRGISNSIFIFLIPIILIATIIVCDTIVSYSAQKKYKKDTEEIINFVLNNEEIIEEDYYEEIKKAYERKNYETEMLVVENNYNGLYLENEHSYFGIFSSLKGYKGKKDEIKILGVRFNVNKNSKTIIKVTAYKDDNNITYEYEK